jgi:hypothetical protein
MARWKTGKWAGKTLTREQRKAQGWWRKATQDEGVLCGALHVTSLGQDRETLHQMLDRRLEAIAETRRRATELFPEVSESLVVASMDVEM